MKRIKDYVTYRLVVCIFSIILLTLFYYFPVKKEKTDTTIEIDLKENVIYLLDKDNYLSRVISYYDEESITDIIKSKIDTLINGSPYLNDFNTIIPKNTKINSLKIDKDNIYIDFNSELLNVESYNENKIIESLVYTLTEINGINNIYISINNEKLTYLPKSNIILPYPLTRNYGINKEYDISDLSNLNKTTIYFSKTNNLISYYVPVTKITNNEDNIELIIKELKSGVNSQNKLMSSVNNNLEVLNYKKVNNTMEIMFNDYIFDSDDKVLEEVKYTISNSIFDSCGVDEVIFKDKNSKKIAIIGKNK